MAKNENLHQAKKVKDDEFYTRLPDIESEVIRYRHHFKDKVVFCNCDNPTFSNFWRYFWMHFEDFGLKGLISTHYDANEPTYKQEIWRNQDGTVDCKMQTIENSAPMNLPKYKVTPLQQNGDFRSPECIELLTKSDIVVTNEPFSLTRPYIAQLMEHEKKFLIIVSKNAITYKEIFPLIKENKIWLGYNSPKTFIKPNGEEQTFGNIGWFTNLDIDKRHEPLLLDGSYYSPEDYPKYDNYDAINVDKVSDIPCDYCESIGVPVRIVASKDDLDIVRRGMGPQGEELAYIKVCSNGEDVETLKTQFAERYGCQPSELDYCSGVMGVPITFLDKYCPEQFEIIDINPHFFALIAQGKKKPKQLTLHNAGRKKDPYARILISAKSIYTGIVLEAKQFRM